MDNIPEFANKCLENFLQDNNIKTHFTTPNYHNSNGLINQAHSIFIEIMNIIVTQEDSIPIKEIIKLALIPYNNTPNSNLKLSPKEITFDKIKENLEIEPIISQQLRDNNHKEK